MEKSTTILATKGEMRTVFDNQGRAYPVTAVDTTSCVVVGNRTLAKNGYEALILGLGARREKTVSRAHAVSINKTGLTSLPRYLKEIRTTNNTATIGTLLNLSDLFSLGDLVTVSGITKGKGFAGVVKRHGFAGGPRTHGQSDRERAPGSISSGTTPGRVRKGKRMAGRMGHETKTVTGLTIQNIDVDNHLLFIRGALPGIKGGLITISK